MKQVVSVSLGTSKRDKTTELNWFGETVRLERRGTDGDLAKFAQTFRDLDGKVDALGVGGADLTLRLGERKYVIQQIARIVRQVRRTPVVDGSGLKHTLERETIRTLAAGSDLQIAGKTALMVSAVDRFGMAIALEEAGAKMIYGDLMFGLGVDYPLRSYKQVTRFGRVILPVITQLPIQWFYPTGKQQEERKPKYGKIFKEVDIAAGDWHYIRRYMPDDMRGKSIITQTVRQADLELLKKLGVETVVTTTPDLDGETLATNVMEAAILAISGTQRKGEISDELSDDEYKAFLTKLGWKPNVIQLQK